MTDKTPVSRPITAVLQRLLGAVILVAAAAVLVPLLLDGQGMRQTTDRPDIPAEPAFDVRLGESGQPEVRLLDVKSEVDQALAPLEPLEALEPEDALGRSGEEPVPDVATTDGAGRVVTESVAAAALPSSVSVAAPSPAKLARAPDVAPPLAAKPTTPPATAAKPFDAALAEAWMLQMGAFKDRSNAQKTLALLQAKGFRASLNSRTPGVIKVQVGPELRRDRAEALRQRVASATGINGVLVRFQP